MFSEITAITASLPTDRALVGASGRVLRNVRVKLPVSLACKEGLGQTSPVYSRKQENQTGDRWVLMCRFRKFLVVKVSGQCLHL